MLTAVLINAAYAQQALSPPAEKREVEVRARGTSGEERIRLIVDGQIVATWNLTTSIESYYGTTVLQGPMRVEFFNDDHGRDVRVDSLSVNGIIHQAEDQSVNTGAFQNGKCGGGKGRTEWMRCNGYIEFQNL